jgi:hypothetical protein
MSRRGAAAWRERVGSAWGRCAPSSGLKLELERELERELEVGVEGQVADGATSFRDWVQVGGR